MDLVFITALYLAGLLGLFLAGWVLVTLGVAAKAVLQGNNVKQAIAPLLEEL